jgi:hypothetical protein
VGSTATGGAGGNGTPAGARGEATAIGGGTATPGVAGTVS